MVGVKVLLVASLVTVAQARPQSPVYSYRFEAPRQTKEESRDVLGNIRGSYSVEFPDGGGRLVYNYAHSAQQPVFRTTADGPLGPAGTIIAFGKENSKASSFLIEMLEQRLDNREPPIVTKTEAVLIEALPAGAGDQQSTTDVQFSPGSGVAKADRPKTPSSGAEANLIREQEGFVNSKESPFLPIIRQESLLTEDLGGRNPPIVGEEEIIVEASDI